MQIWRVENPEGYGPYQFYFEDDTLCEKFNDLKMVFSEKGYEDDKRIHPLVDFYDRSKLYHRNNAKNNDVFYGCVSVEQLRKWWFWHELNAFMAENNFKVVCYECDDYATHADDFQVMFIMKEAKKISEHRIEEFLEISESLAMAA